MPRCVSWLLPEYDRGHPAGRGARIERCGARCSTSSSRTATSWCSRRCSSTSIRCSPAPAAISSCAPSRWSTRCRAACWACAPTSRRRSRASTRTCSTSRASRACATAGSVLHTRAGRPRRRRARSIQIGAELYGDAGDRGRPRGDRAAPVGARAAGVRDLHLDLGHVGVYRALAARRAASPATASDSELFAALRAKDVPARRRS